MEGLTHRWIVRREGDAHGLADKAPGSLAERVLLARGLTDAESIEAFLNPRLTDLHDPSRMANLDQAAGRVLDALRRGQRIVIYGDYDVDGVTAAAILWRMCRALAPDCDSHIHIPHRIDDGYGVHTASLEEFHADGADLVVTVDCGVTATEAAARARELGLDLIITDHHLPKGGASRLPDALHLVHPAIPEGVYPCEHLCGAGVAYKIAWRMATMAHGDKRVPQPLRETLLDLLALTALGTVADVVPLVEENRIITRFGLARMKSTRIVGLNALISASKLDDERMSAEKVGFVLGPRLNACGRLGHAREAAELLTTEDPARASVIALELDAQNKKRREMEAAIADEADAMAVERGMTVEGCRAIVLGAPHWHPGVIGIVCSRLVERRQRPVILLKLDGDEAYGSCRSIDAFNVHEALNQCSNHLTRFGGHAMAAGLRLDASRVDAFTQAFTDFANRTLAPEDLRPTLDVDCACSLSELTPQSIAELSMLGPFGRSNPEPALLVQDLVSPGGARVMGVNGKHLQLHVKHNGAEIRCVGWGWGRHRATIPVGAQMDVVIRPRVNEWRGRRTIEGQILDIHLHGDTRHSVSSGATAQISRGSSRCPS